MMNFVINIFIISISSVLSKYPPKVDKLNYMVELAWPFDNDTIYWDNRARFILTKIANGQTSDGGWFATEEHGGTHLDAPYHFNENGWKVGDIPLSRLIANGITINLSKETKILKDNTRLLPKHIIDWESKHGAIPPNSVILVDFGWSKYYTNKNKYLGVDANNRYNFPGISKEAAELIARSGNIVGIGVDTASVDPGISRTLDAHKIFAMNAIYALENIKVPPIFPDKGYTLYVVPMNIKEGTGAPLHLIALLS